MLVGNCDPKCVFFERGVYLDDGILIRTGVYTDQTVMNGRSNVLAAGEVSPDGPQTTWNERIQWRSVDFCNFGHGWSMVFSLRVFSTSKKMPDQEIRPCASFSFEFLTVLITVKTSPLPEPLQTSLTISVALRVTNFDEFQRWIHCRLEWATSKSTFLNVS